MKKIFVIFLVLICSNLYSQNKTVFDSLSVVMKDLKSNSIINSKDKRLINLLNNLYDETLQDANGELSSKTATEYNNFKNNKNLANWHLFYLFNEYQNYITNSINSKPNAGFQIALMKILAGEFNETYKTIPPIVLIYMGEALMSANMNDKAISHFRNLLQYFPDSIPIKVHLYQLTKDKSEKEKLYRDLKKRHSDHWMVKQFLI